MSAIACSILMLLGLLGSVLPFLPGIPLAWLGLLVYAVGTGFQKISITTTIVFFIITLGTMAIGYFAPVLGAKKYKASRAGIIGASLGLAVGIIVFNIWGIIIGPFLGAMLGELVAQKAPHQAFKSALGTFAGFITGTLLQIIVILIMAGFFLISLF
ncbi:MAG: DUF456 domain-containing protein [Dehalococcoidales bacterium]|nr:DUF456 domain-containing protein [Dehalococcoidales bacterium]